MKIYCDIDDVLINSSWLLMDCYSKAGLSNAEIVDLFNTKLNFSKLYPHKMDIHKKKEDSYCQRLFEPGNQIIINEFLIYALKYYNSTHGSVRLLTTGSERSTMAKVKRLHLENLLITYAAPKLSLDFWAKLPTGLVIDDCERVLNLANQAGHQIMQVKI